MNYLCTSQTFILVNFFVLASEAFLLEVFLGNSVLKVCSNFTGEHSYQKRDFNKVALQFY